MLPLNFVPIQDARPTFKKKPSSINFHFSDELWLNILGFLGSWHYPTVARVSQRFLIISTEALGNKVLLRALNKQNLSLAQKVQIICWLSFYKNIRFEVKNLEALKLALKANNVGLVVKLLSCFSVQTALRKKPRMTLEDEQNKIVEARVNIQDLRNWVVRKAVQKDFHRLLNVLISPQDLSKGEKYKQRALTLACSQGKTEVVRIILQNLLFSPSYNNNEAFKALWNCQPIDANALKILLDHPCLDLSIENNFLIKEACGRADSSLVRILLARPEINICLDLAEQLLTIIIDHLQKLEKLQSSQMEVIKKTELNIRGLPSPRHDFESAQYRRQIIDQKHLEQEKLKSMRDLFQRYIQMMSLLIADPRIAAPLTTGNHTPQVDMTLQLINCCIKIPQVLTINDNYMIRFASKWGTIELVTLILTNLNVDPSACDNQALKEALQRPDWKIVHLLLDYSAVTGYLQSSEKLAPEKIQQKIELIHLLLKSGLTPSSHQSLLFRMACRYGALELVSQWLRDPRVNPAAEGQQAIKVAAEQGYTPIVRLLIRDSRVDPTVQLQEPVRLAASQGNLETIQALLENKKVDPSLMNNWGLRTASRNGHHKTVEFLMKHPQVSRTIKDSLPQTLENACQNGHFKVVKVLLNHPDVDPSLNNYRAFSLAYDREEDSKNFEIVKLLIHQSKLDLDALRQWVIDEKLKGVRPLISSFIKTAEYKRRKIAHIR